MVGGRTDGWTDSCKQRWGRGNKCPFACLSDCQIVERENMVLSSVSILSLGLAQTLHARLYSGFQKPLAL